MVFLRVQYAFLDEELGPGNVAVAVDQRVVKVEERELHADPCIAAFSNGTVTGLRFSSE